MDAVSARGCRIGFPRPSEAKPWRPYGACLVNLIHLFGLRLVTHPSHAGFINPLPSTSSINWLLPALSTADYCRLRPIEVKFVPSVCGAGQSPPLHFLFFPILFIDHFSCLRLVWHRMDAPERSPHSASSSFPAAIRPRHMRTSSMVLSDRGWRAPERALYP